MAKLLRASLAESLVTAFFILISMLSASAQEGLGAGSAVLTRFGGTVAAPMDDGRSVTVLDPDGVTGLALDPSTPGATASGRLLGDLPPLFAVTARQTGQVFGIALDDAPSPNVYLAATSAFGLHRTADNTAWMAGMWGEGGGPGTVYRLSPDGGYAPTVFATIGLDGRPNSAAGLGNIAYDRWTRQLYVSDLETGMVHRLRLGDGADLGHWDHGERGRTRFLDVASGQQMTLPPVAFDPASTARIADCPSGDFTRDPGCWNVADFRRGVWGVGVHHDNSTGDTRLFYAVWGSQNFGRAAPPDAGPDVRNAVWSVRIMPDGDFDAESVRREFVLPDFFRGGEDLARAGSSRPVSDIAFPAFGNADVMLLAERGGLRNRGLDAEDSFAWPQESRVLRYERGEDGVWHEAGRYDIGFSDRRAKGPPYLRAGAAGGVTFAMGYGPDGTLDRLAPDAFAWATGDALCGPDTSCGGASGAQVSGAQGFDPATIDAVEPEAAVRPYPSPGPAYPPTGPEASYFIDVDPPTDPGRIIRNDATRVGDVEAVQSAPRVSGRPDEGPWIGPWDGDWPWPVPGPDFIPPDDPLALPDLAVTKSTPYACQWGEPCTFLISLTNRGWVTYSGPVHIVDTPEHTGFLTVASPGWTCVQPDAPGAVACRHDPVTLEPGEGIDLALTLGMPMAAGPLPPWPVERTNCAFIAWPSALAGPARIRAVEATLLAEGYPVGPVDGLFDPATQDAVNQYRLVHGLPPGGIDEDFMARLYPDSAGLAGDAVADNDHDCRPFRLPGTDPLPPPGPVAGIDLHLQKWRLTDNCAAGLPCVFAVGIRNEGTVGFHGHLEFLDTAQILGEGALPAAAISAADPVLLCNPAVGGGQRCTPAGAGEYHLPPGAMMAYRVRIDVPPGMEGHDLQNCGFIRWAGSPLPGGDAAGWNDFHCVTAPLPMVAPAEAGADLALEKTSGTCTLVGDDRFDCDFTLRIRNAGTGPFAGIVQIRDGGPEGVVYAGSSDDGSPAWSCGQAGGGGDVNCRSAATVELDPGAEEEIGLTLNMPVEVMVPGAQNCIDIDWGAMAFAGGHDAVPGNDHACSDLVVVTRQDMPSDLRAEVLAVSENCRPIQACSFAVRIHNWADSPYSGPIVFRTWSEVDAAPGTLADPAGLNAPDWTCTAEGGINICRTDVVDLEPRQFRQVQVYVDIPRDTGIGDSLSQVAAIDWPAAGLPDGDADGSNDEARATLPVTAPDIDLAVTKRVLPGQTCHPGDRCAFMVEIENRGTDFYYGELAFDDIANIGGVGLPALATTATGVWDCSQYGATPLIRRCSTWTGRIDPGESEPAMVLVDVVHDVTHGELTNCARLAWDAMDFPGGRDSQPANDGTSEPVCATAAIESGAAPDEGPAEQPLDIDMRIEKHGPATCERGADCEFVITVVNDGPRNYTGPIIVRDDLPADSGAALSILPGWNCGLAAPNFHCQSTNPEALDRFDARSLTLRWTVPSDYPLGPTRNCTSLEWVGGMNPDTTWYHRVIELALSTAGYDPGAIDGSIDAEARSAIRDYRAVTGLPAGDTVDRELVEALFAGTAMLAEDQVGSNNRRCTEVEIVGQRSFDIAVSMVPAVADCRPGGQCAYQVTFFNSGPEPYEGALAFRTWVEDAAGAERLAYAFEGATGWSCGHGDEDGVMWCMHPSDLQPGGSPLQATVTVNLPVESRWDGLTSTATMDWNRMGLTGDDEARNDTASALQVVADSGADLEPVGHTECQRGSECRLETAIRNSGRKPFAGAAGLSGTLDPAVEITRIESRTDGLKCTVIGTGRYECIGPNLSVGPGEEALFDVFVSIPADFASATIRHGKAMVWPDAGAKDRNPGNDENASTITIVGSQAADLSLSKAAAQSSCAAGARCAFTVSVRNNGPGTYSGPLVVVDTIAGVTASLERSSPDRWSCRHRAGSDICVTDNLELAAGQAMNLQLSYVPAAGRSGEITNCARLDRSPDAMTAPVQEALNRAGFDAGPADGLAGRRTRAAIAAYRQANGLPGTGVIDDVFLDQLLGLSAIDPDQQNDSACATLPVEASGSPSIELPEGGLPPAEQPRTVLPQCPEGWHAVTAAESKSLATRGIPIRIVREGSITVFCARPFPPQTPQCESGWDEVSASKAKVLATQGWQIRQVTGTGGSITCARRLPGPVCPAGWNEVSTSKAKALAGQGYDIREVQRNSQSVLCARKRAEPDPVCPASWNEVSKSKAKALAGQGYDIREVQRGGKSILCARKRPVAGPVCPGGWNEVTKAKAKALVGQGYEIREVKRNNEAILCARKRATPAQATCPAGWTKLDRQQAKALQEKGWKIQQVGTGKSSILCGRK